jgi:phage-related protein
MKSKKELRNLLSSIEEIVEAQLERIEEVKNKIKEEDDWSAIAILEQELKELESSLEGHEHRVREVKIKKLID